MPHVCVRGPSTCREERRGRGGGAATDLLHSAPEAFLPFEHSLLRHHIRGDTHQQTAVIENARQVWHVVERVVVDDRDVVLVGEVDGSYLLLKKLSNKSGSDKYSNFVQNQEIRSNIAK